MKDKQKENVLPQWVKSQIEAKCKMCFKSPEYRMLGGHLCHLCTYGEVKIHD